MKTLASPVLVAVSRSMALAFLIVLVMAVSVVTAQTAPASEKHKSVLVLSSDDSNLSPQIIFEQALRSTLKKGSPLPLEVYSEYLDSNRTRVDDYEKELVALLRRKYEGRKFDLIIAVSATALRVLLKNQPEIFPDTPVVFLVLDQRMVAGLDLRPNVTGVWGEINFKPNLDFALALHPKTTKVAVIAGVSGFDKYLTAKLREDFLVYEGKLEITYLIGLTIAEQQQALSSLPQHTLVVFVSTMRDNAGNNYHNPEVLRQISPASSAPIYGTTDVQLGLGIVGGSVLSFEALGVRTAELGLRILAGEKPQAIAPHGVPNVVMFDWRELRRWGIDENKLPAGSIVRYKEFSVWELYKWRIIGAVALIILQALLIIALLINRSRRRQAEAENERLARVAEAEHQRLDEVVSNVPGLVWEVSIDPDSGERKTSFVSRFVEQMLGFNEEDFLGKQGFGLSLVPEEDRERVERQTNEIFATGQSGTIQYRWLTKSAQLIWVEAQIAVMRDEHDRPIGLRGVTMDITGRKEADEALQIAHEEVSKLKNQLQEENLYLQEEIKSTLNVDEIVGRSNAIKYVLFKIEQVSKTDSTVMILGETGTGKELVARAIHSQSLRKDRPLVKVNCAALSAGLIESELFGHEKGSFTGAVARKIGRFELADGATLFLDEIGELPLDLQSKLLRVIQEGEFERLGSSTTKKVDVRIIAATNRNMKAEVEKGAFREDLWYRLNVFPITVPPLLQRKEDIPPMVEHFVSSFSRKVGKNITAVSSAALKKLQDYSWPGNVRELANVIERGVINAQGPVLYIADQFEQAPVQQPNGTSRTLDEIEKEYIIRILGDTAWKIEGPNGAAKILGLNPSTLRTRMVKLGIQKGAHTSAKG